jgi:pre-mRNA cleavage complex 2 protein Pcf11
MSYSQGPDDIAEDFKVALTELSMNSRYEISNLTMIAKENTEHAFAISEALKAHIKAVRRLSRISLVPLLTLHQTSPQKKLPAFYVLDSIVKNVGTPYTLFFGRQLYATFMEAYALVDNSVRRKMDEMLKTWKEPVPGSMDPRPVFPAEITRPIENALIKAKTSFVQAHQEHLKNQQQQLNRGRGTASPAGYRDTPTPPNAYRPPPPNTAPGYAPTYPPQQQYPPPPMNGQQFPNQPNGQQPYGLPPVRTLPFSYCIRAYLSQRPPSQQYPPQVAAGPSSWQQPPSQGYQVAENSIARLNSDIDKLITTSKAEWAQNPYDNSIGTRLKALLDLQTILQSQQLPPDQIALIKDQVDQLSIASQSAHKTLLPPAPVHPPAPVAAAQPPAQQPSLSSILGPGALAALARVSATRQPTPPMLGGAQIRSPQPAYAQPPYQQPPTIAPTSTPAPEASSLLERLRAAGMLPAISTPTSAPTPLSSLPIPPGFPPSFLNTPPSASRTPLANLTNDVVLKPASLKE